MHAVLNNRTGELVDANDSLLVGCLGARPKSLHSVNNCARVLSDPYNVSVSVAFSIFYWTCDLR